MKKKKVIIIGAGVILIIVIAIFLFNPGKHEYQLRTSVINEGTIETTVTATGYVQPVDKVDVGTQVSGVIEKIFVDFNSQVKKGQLLAELDKSTLNEKVTQAKASLISAESDQTYAQQNYDRTKQLYEVKAATQAAYEEATNKLAQAKTSVANAKANLHQANVNLSYAEIYSPIDGVVLNREVEQGQTVAASFNTPTLFTIANDLTKMQVEADVDEADIGQVRVGQKVNFTVDAYNDETFEGTVDQIRLQPTVTNNVVTYTVIVEAPNPEEKLFPGMTASITIITNSEKGLLVPLEALNFQPDEKVLAKYGNPQEVQKNKSMSPPPHAGGALSGKNKGVWLFSEEHINPEPVEVGTGDGVNAIVKSGLKKGDTVVLSVSLEKKEKNENAVSNPLMPSPPKRR